jgi:hypothetical protein
MGESALSAMPQREMADKARSSRRHQNGERYGAEAEDADEWD